MNERTKKERVRLAGTKVEEFQCEDGKLQDFLWDSEAPGFALRATAGGNKAYIFQGRLDGKSLRITIGDIAVWRIADARQEARRLQAIIDQGRDPREVKAEVTAADVAARRKVKHDSTPAMTAWKDYMKARAPRWSARHHADHETMSREGGQAIKRGRRAGMAAVKEPGILRPLLVRPLAEITRDAVADWLSVEAPRRPTRTRLAVSLLGAFLRWCGDRPEWRDTVHLDACARMKRELPQPAAKDDCLQREQLLPWFDAVRRIKNPVIAAYLQITLLTGARREEIARLQWSDVDLEWGSLTIHDKAESHGGQDGKRTIPLTPYVKALLVDLRRRGATVRPIDGKPPEPSPWVFASYSAAGYIAEPRIAHVKALQAAGLPPLSIHGLRRSFGTLAEWVEAPTGVVAQIMGHRPSAIAEKHYRRRPLDLLRKWHTKIEGWILKEANIAQPKEEARKLKNITVA